MVNRSQCKEDQARHMKPSYRHKGTGISGSLYRGSTSHAYTKKTISSIPSKYETVLYPQENSTKKGFGSKGFRFATKISNNPGPGAYYDGAKVINKSLHFTSDSFSKKGYGNGFVSTCNRFRIDNYHSYQVPGPGSYKIHGLILSNKKFFAPGSVSEKYKCKLTSSFVQHKEKRKVDKQRYNLGPGSYDILKDFGIRNRQRTAIFKTKDMRSLTNKINFISPGPGEYETDKEGLRRGVSQVSLNEGGSANFKQASGAKRVKVNLYDPFENVENEDKITPGPGQYSDDQYNIFKRSMSGSSLKSSMFVASKVLDRFGKLKHITNKQFPGPGEYHNSDKVLRKSTTVEKIKSRPSFIFRSEVQRTIYIKKDQAPGPAFYKLRSHFTKETKNPNPIKEWI